MLSLAERSLCRVELYLKCMKDLERTFVDAECQQKYLS